MRHVIYGAGAIGSVMGGYLVQSGAEAVLIGRPAHVEAVRARGLKITGIKGDHEVRMEAVAHPAELVLREDDVIHLTVKSQDTPEVAGVLAGCQGRELPIFCFQNGVRNERILTQAGFTRVYGGIAYFGATYLSPGEVMNTSRNALGIGLYPEGLDETAQRVAEDLQRAGFFVAQYERIMEGKYTKLLTNLNNVVYPACGFSLQEAQTNEEARAFMASVLEEGLKVIRAAGIGLASLPGGRPPEDLIRALREKKERPLAGSPFREDIQVRPSTWQDFYHQRGKSEVEHFNGEVEALGQEVGIPTPYNALLGWVNRKMLEEGLGLGCFTIGDLEAMLR
ncbi:MAG: 2-dehydropantoate 2-reductase [Candidatus Tectomicrobia bacterium]|uniref:2-dehydropantoate 2-reductase n=1 Tax=Tectimicrobiota bacterium TaxID=2528274 RepID=A0A932FZN6_UNCTE|nr:2-dehydropantoate 2-reductase [Candidatus Tectomicrobia bacterium]